MVNIDHWAWIKEMNLTRMFALSKSPKVLGVKHTFSQRRNSATKTWGDDLVRRVPVVQAEGPKFGPQTSMFSLVQWQRSITVACGLWLEWRQTGGSLQFAIHPI